MSLQPVLKYPLDLSGVSPNNLVVGEIQSLPETSPNRSIAPYYGAFFTEGLKIRNLGFRVFVTAYENIPLTGSKPLVIGIKDVSQEYLATGLPVYIRLSNQTNVAQNGFYSYHESGSSYTLILETGGVLLTPGEQYVPTMLHQEASRISGKEVCQLLVVTDQLVLGDLVLEYQAIGGDYSVSSDALETLIETLQLDARPVVWGEIIGLPNLFPPVEHIHHIQDFKGFGHLVDAIDDLRLLLSGELLITPGGGGGGLTIHVGATPPPTPVLKQLWWNNETLRMFLYYEDGVGSNVWVEVSGSAGTGVGGGSSPCIWKLYPSRNLVEVPPEYTLIGYISVAVDETTPNIVSMNIKGDLSTAVVYNNNFSGEDFTLIFDRMAGIGRIIVNAGNVSNSPFYSYLDNANNRYVIFMQNNANRNAFSVSTFDIDYITLDNLQINYTLPDLLSACQLIDQHKIIYEMDIVELISNLNTTLNSISGFFEDQVRPIYSEGAV